MRRIIFLLFLSCPNFIVESFAQSNKYPVAPEVWSTPEKILAISQPDSRAESPSTSFDGNKLYFSGIRVSEKTDTGWSIPKSLNDNINQHLASLPCISPNGKRLFFSWYIGGWDLYYSDWDNITNDWGIAKSCNFNLDIPEDSYRDERGCSLPDDSTIIFLSGYYTFISHFNSATQSWDTARGFPTPSLQFGSDWGIYVSPNRKKIYYAGFRSDTTINGQYYGNYDIIVRYKDPSFPGGYTIPYILNFCLETDSLYFSGNYSSRFEGYPTLTPDGRTMYFTADYHGQITIYETRMLVDENGDTVTTVINENPSSIPENIKLYPVYPNPFNPEVNIRYSLDEDSQISLIVYDILGREVKKIFEGRKLAGEYEEIFSNKNLTSGIYLIKLSSKKSTQVQKAALLK